jgi:hypothetical protein
LRDGDLCVKRPSVGETAAERLKIYWKEQTKEFCMKIIVLTGQEKVGKTTVLNLVYDDLIDSTKPNPWNIIHRKSTKGNPNQRDFSCVLEKNGKKIAFYTMGDYATHVIGAIDIFIGLDIEILLLACNNNCRYKKCESDIGTPNEWIEKFENVPIEKCLKSSDEDCKDKLLETIDRLLD